MRVSRWLALLLHSETEARDFVAARCTADAMAKLELFVARLREENAVQNLVAAATLDQMWLRHIADSAQLLDLVPRETGPWLDLGSGAGFPGLVIAAMQPVRAVVLVESRKLRIQWLVRMIEELGLENCHVVGQDVRRAEQFDAGIISARAFAPLPRLIALSDRFSTNTTAWVLPKGRSASQDIAALPKQLQPRFHVKHSVTDSDARILVAKGRMGLAA